MQMSLMTVADFGHKRLWMIMESVMIVEFIDTHIHINIRIRSHISRKNIFEYIYVST